MKNKTLKDIKLGNYCGECGKEFVVDIEPLKKEAIKLVKILRKDFREEMPWDDGYDAHDGELIRFLMWQNNLTEEDLE